MLFYATRGSDRPDTDLPIRLFLWPLFRSWSFGVSKGQSKKCGNRSSRVTKSSKDLQLGVSNCWNVIKLDIKSNPVMLSLLCFFVCLFCSYSSRQLKHIAHGLCIYRLESRQSFNCHPGRKKDSYWLNYADQGRKDGIGWEIQIRHLICMTKSSGSNLSSIFLSPFTRQTQTDAGQTLLRSLGYKVLFLFFCQSSTLQVAY